MIHDLEKEKLKFEASKLLARFGHKAPIQSWYEYKSGMDAITLCCGDCESPFDIYYANRNGQTIFILWAGKHRIALFNQDCDFEQMLDKVPNVYCKRFRVMW